jgi:YaaC-like Protein
LEAPPARVSSHVRRRPPAAGSHAALELLIDGLPPDADLDTLLRYLGDYPTAEGTYMWHTQGMREDMLVTQPSPLGLLPVFCWPDVPTDGRLRARRLDEIAPDYRGRGSRLLLPRAGCRYAISPLMLWWALLFGLSSIARYDPETWVGALAVNDSDLAVPIEAALGAALEALPDLILNALTNPPVTASTAAVQP